MVEIEKCKRDISDIKDQIWNAQKKFIDFNRMRYAMILYVIFIFPGGLFLALFRLTFPQMT